MRSRALVFAAAVLLVVPALWAHPVKRPRPRARPTPSPLEALTPRR